MVLCGGLARLCLVEGLWEGGIRRFGGDGRAEVAGAVGRARGEREEARPGACDGSVAVVACAGGRHGGDEGEDGEELHVGWLLGDGARVGEDLLSALTGCLQFPP